MSGHEANFFEVSVIIPAYNAASTIIQQLEALDRQEGAPPFEVIVADNGSRDTTSPTVRSYRPSNYSLRLVDASARRGAASARNRGAMATPSRYLVFCDADDIVGRRYVASMVETLRTHDLASGIISTVAFSQSDHPSLRQLDDVEEALARGPRSLMRVDGFYDQVMSGALGARHEAHSAIGGFREDLIGGGEDLHYGSVAQIAGSTLGLAADAVVHVRPARGMWNNFHQQRLWSARGMQVLWELREHGERQFSLKSSLSGALSAAGKAPVMLRADLERKIQWSRDLGGHVGELSSHLRYRRSHILNGVLKRMRSATHGRRR